MGKKTYSFGMADAPKDFGNPPDLDPSDVYQFYPDTCAIRSQELILKDFGIDISQEDLIQQAIDHGWYEPGQGTMALDVGKLLELNGVPVHQYENGNIFSLVNELAQGHKVIVGVDADELWHNEPDWLDNAANHALLVSNIDTTDPNNITVTLTDPGTGDVAKVYSFEQFEAAWKDSNCFICATQDPVPLTADYMCNFDYETGHLDTVFHGLPFDDFQTHFGCMFNMDVTSQEFGLTLVDTLNNPSLRVWVANGAGVIADIIYPGSGIPVREAVRFGLDIITGSPSPAGGLGADGGLVDPDSILDPNDHSSVTDIFGNTDDSATDSFDDPSQGVDTYSDVSDAPIDDIGGVDDFGDMGGFI
ncbi:MAG: hypothetical protein IKX40_11925 [Thermoguttaceae bacterium]|nr:hypothetical protein [Thermoguttaceae bacterium]